MKIDIRSRIINQLKEMSTDSFQISAHLLLDDEKNQMSRWQPPVPGLNQAPWCAPISSKRIMIEIFSGSHGLRAWPKNTELIILEQKSVAIQ